MARSTLNLIAAYAQSTGAKPENTDQFVYIQVTRGELRDHVMPTDITPTVFVMTNALKQPVAEQRAHGVACTADDFHGRGAYQIDQLAGLGIRPAD